MNKTKLLIVAALSSLMLAGCGAENGNTSQSPSPAATHDANTDSGIGGAAEDIIDGAGNAAKDIGDGVGTAVKDAGKAIDDVAGGGSKSSKK